MFQKLTAGSLAAALTLAPLTGASHAQASGQRPSTAAPFVLKAVTDVQEIAQLTGKDSINKTDRYDVYGCDLGSMFNAGNRTYFLFGDTFGFRPADMTGGGGQDWRSGTMAYTTTADPSKGLRFNGWITDGEGDAKEILPSLKIDNVEMTKIPTYGVAVGKNLYIYYMSVKHWGPPGVWYTNYSGIAKSTDGGQTWQFLKGDKWPGNSNFIQMSIYKVQEKGRTEIYFWCIPAGRFGGVKLMRVSAADIENLSKYQYFAGTDADGNPIWSSQMSRAVQVVNDTVGELSVIFDPYLKRWIMMYLQGGGSVVIREGITQWGPWGPAITVATQDQYPGLYGPFMNPRYMGNGGQYIYFTLSLWGPYNVFWMRAKLVK
ncbi:MAG: DUF4185 domain-containing protein [Alicyclobacillus sp.]|nr:DUF4185 domain-containing protein [Alicyclobacillus sp.]